jgi:NADPH-dependent glutamate synthase beta subunit-like oxidoreductase/NAD(P)H-flavin reductase
MNSSGINSPVLATELYSTSGMKNLDARFLETLDAELKSRLLAARATPPAGKPESELILALAPYVEIFIAKTFGIEQELAESARAQEKLAPVFKCKRLFVQRRAAKAFKAEEVRTWREEDLGFRIQDSGEEFEIAFSEATLPLLEEGADAAKLDAALRYAAWALYHPEGIKKHRKGLLFKIPKKIDPAHLIPMQTVDCSGFTAFEAPKDHLRAREGFALTDDGGTLAQALDHANYCIFCAHQGKDSCSKGFAKKTPLPLREGQGEGSSSIATTPHPNPLPQGERESKNGCPLEEHISEMNELKSEGGVISALAAVVIANPMCAGTGHRICNDCMKACIYQKQEPVNIPLVETRVLNDVLSLPYGFEIYSLLTRWNPLNFARPYPKEDTGKSVLVVGLGPAGYTLSHHLMNDGHRVYAVDGLKIEPLVPPPTGEGVFPLIKHIHDYFEPLDTRTQAGFGGVAEYGITVRWNKNYLKVIRLLLERREQFRMQGGVRFGSQLTAAQAFDLGFDHIALCLGAGKPTLLNIPNGMARGVRAASDFLMSLQLTGAAKKESIANMHLRLPVVVIGGGLTAIDTATEALAYYAVQVEKFLTRYETLGAKFNASLSDEERETADVWLAHARALRKAENKLALLQQWGGATIAYRKKITDAPSFRLNHEEVEKAFEEGIRFIENVEPEAFEVDAYQHVSAIRFKDGRTLPARSILVAAGTSPNTVIAREEPDVFELQGAYFKPAADGFSIHTREDGRSISMFGDLHPKYAGNVVKAMSSAKAGYPVVSKLLQDSGFRIQDSGRLFDTLDDLLTTTVVKVERLTPTIVEVVLRAPAAARNFKPGQFFRLQNYETSNQQLATSNPMESLAMTGAWVDRERGLVSIIVLEMGGSSNLCADLKEGERVVLMGPTGAPTEIPENETVVLVGGGLGNAVLFSIGKAMREAGNKVIYFAGYRSLQDRFRASDIEAAADVVVWCCDEAPGFTPTRAGDTSFVGNMVAAMGAHAELVRDANRVIAIGSDKMMAAVAQARKTLAPKAIAIGSINSPMQCMMKEICAQCIQEHVDADGKISYVFSCTNQDQCLDDVSFPHLAERLKQNSLQEKLTAAWIRLEGV